MTKVKGDRRRSLLRDRGVVMLVDAASVPFTLAEQRVGGFSEAVAMFEIVGDITNVQVIATGRGIRRLKTLRKRHGGRHWRKLKGDATVRLATE